MKTFLQDDESGLFYQEQGWVKDVAHARAFSTLEEAEAFRRDRHISATHLVGRIDPALIARALHRAPGAYQAGE